MASAFLKYAGNKTDCHRNSNYKREVEMKLFLHVLSFLTSTGQSKHPYKLNDYLDAYLSISIALDNPQWMVHDDKDLNAHRSLTTRQYSARGQNWEILARKMLIDIQNWNNND